MGSEVNDFEEVKFRVETAQKMVGSATISMDPDTLEHATTAVEAARSQLEIMKSVATDLDEPFLMNEEKKQDTKKHPENFRWMFFHDNCSPYFFNVSPTVHCLIQNE